MRTESVEQGQVEVTRTANLSVVVLAKNEAINMERCLASLHWCDDILVVDDYSTDETASIAVSFGARVLTHKFESFAAQRNWALEQGELRHPWVLMLDADEVVTDELVDEFRTAIVASNNDVAGFMLCRKTMFLGKWIRHSDGFPVWIARVLHRERAKFINRGHGEKAVADECFRFEKIHTPFLHFPFSKGVSDWVDRHNRYSTLEAALEADPHRAIEFRWAKLFGRDGFRRRQALLALSRKLPCRPLLRFCYQYFWKLGILDGRAGLAFCFLMSYFEGLIVLKRREHELKQRGQQL